MSALAAPKFTPGPWRVGYRTIDIVCENAKIGGQAKLFDVRGWGYLTGNGHGALGLDPKEAMEIQQANADLAAAAPDLYDIAVECLELAKLAATLTGCRGDDDYVWGIQERLEAALSKANPHLPSGAAACAADTADGVSPPSPSADQSNSKSFTRAVDEPGIGSARGSTSAMPHPGVVDGPTASLAGRDSGDSRRDGTQFESEGPKSRPGDAAASLTQQSSSPRQERPSAQERSSDRSGGQFGDAPKPATHSHSLPPRAPGSESPEAIQPTSGEPIIMTHQDIRT